MDVGRPLIIRSDGRPQFRSGFEQWCKNMMIKHELSSSYNPQSNGHAEQAVKTVKGLLKKTDTKQWFCGYCQRTAAPAAPYAYKRVSDDKLVLHADPGGKVRQNKKRHHDQSAVQLEQLEIGDQVVIQDPKTSTWSNKGLITDIKDSGRSYIIDLASGGHQTRNRRQIRPSRVGQVHGSSGTIDHTKKNITTDGQLYVSGTKDQINSPIRRRSNRPKKKITYTE